MTATYGGRTQLLVAAFPAGSSSSFILYLFVFLLLLLFSRFSVSSSIPVDDGVVVAADGGKAVQVADRPCSPLSILLSSSSFTSVFSLLLFFGLFQLPFFYALCSSVFISKKQEGGAHWPCQSWHRGSVARAATVQPPYDCPWGVSPMLLHHVVNHKSKLRQVGSGVGIFLKLSEKRRGVQKQGRKFFFFPCLARLGEEEDSQCRSKQHHLALFFLKQWMKWRRFGQNTSFHLKEKRRQNIKFQINLSICVFFSIWSLVSDFFN